MNKVAALLVLVVLAAAAAVLTAVPAATAAPAAAGTVAANNAVELPIVAELNRVRTAHDLAPLRTVRPLRLAAEAHAASMGREGYFSHTPPDGTSFERRIGRFYASAGRRWSAGENLLWSSDPELDAREAVRLWMESPGHRRNILSRAWQEIGIAAVVVRVEAGVFSGGELIVVTAFGVRS